MLYMAFLSQENYLDKINNKLLINNFIVGYFCP